MTAFFVVVENLDDWQPYYPSQDVVTFNEYLEKGANLEGNRVRVINLVFLGCFLVGSSRVDLQACKLEYSIVSPK